MLVMSGLACAAAVAQPPSRLWTRPATPSREALDRLNLQLGWRVAVPVFGTKDGILAIQTFGNQVIVQTRSGAIVALDAATGATQWMARLGDPYPFVQPVGDSDNYFLVPEGTRIHALNRSSGREEWLVDLPATPSSPPSADAERFYVTLTNGRLSAYAFPGAKPAGLAGEKSGASTAAANISAAGREAKNASSTASANTNDPRSSRGASAPSGGSGRTVTVSSSTGARTVTATGILHSNRSAVGTKDITRQLRDSVIGETPRLVWDFQTHLRIHNPPALGTDTMLVVGIDGSVLVLPKAEAPTNPQRRVLDAPVSAPAGHSGDDVYLAAENGTVYAFHLPSRAEYARITANTRDELEPPITWRFGANAPIRFAPVVAGEDVFVLPERGGLVRLSRATGETIWQSPRAERFLAANPKFVYATDQFGRLVVVDRASGAHLSTLDSSAFVIGATNDQTDRVVLAANDGTVISLNDRAYALPLVQTAPPAAPAKVEAEPKASKPAPGKKPEDDKKGNDKKPANGAKPADGTPKGR